MGQTAGVPGNENGGDGGGILGGAAQQARFVALATVGIAKHVGGQDDGDELIAGGGVEEQTRADGRGDEAETAAHMTQQQAGQTLNVATRHHRTAETHGADDEPDGVEHPRHAARRHQFVERSVAGRHLGRTETGDEQPAHDVPIADGREQVRLQDQGQQPCHDRRGEERDERGHLTPDEHARQDGHQEGPERDVEGGVEAVGVLADVQLGARGGAQTCDEEDEERERDAGHGGDQHVADMAEEVGARGRGGQNGRVAERRHLVAEVGTRDDGAGHPRLRHSEGVADAQQRHADGGNRRPRTAGQHADQRTDDAGGDEEELGRHELHTVVDERGHYPTHHPRARHHADEQQHDDGHTDAADGLLQAFLKNRPRHSVAQHGDADAEGRGHEERNLAATRQGVAAKQTDDHSQHSDEHHQRNGGDEGMGNPLRCVGCVCVQGGVRICG